MDDLILVVAIPNSDGAEIAMRLEDPEPILFVHYTDCFPDLVKDFVAHWNGPAYKSRLISFRRHGPGAIECLTAPKAVNEGLSAG